MVVKKLKPNEITANSIYDLFKENKFDLENIGSQLNNMIENNYENNQQFKLSLQKELINNLTIPAYYQIILLYSYDEDLYRHSLPNMKIEEIIEIRKDLINLLNNKTKEENA